MFPLIYDIKLHNNSHFSYAIHTRKITLERKSNHFGGEFMITSSDRQLLQEAYEASKKGIDALSILLNKVYDDDLNFELNTQLQRYREINSKVSDELIESGVMLENKPLDRFKKWSSIQASTIFNTSTKHIADLAIRENSHGLSGITSTLKEIERASDKSVEIANELASFEEECIRKLKSYL